MWIRQPKDTDRPLRRSGKQADFISTEWTKGQVDRTMIRNESRSNLAERISLKEAVVLCLESGAGSCFRTASQQESCRPHYCS